VGSAVAALLSLILETGVDEWSASHLAALTLEKKLLVYVHPEFFTGVCM
jgi:hypothetical protein